MDSCNTFSFKNIKFLVMDEADRLLEGNFDEQVGKEAHVSLMRYSLLIFKCWFSYRQFFRPYQKKDRLCFSVLPSLTL